MNEAVLQNTITWWEKKRLLFNILVGIVGSVGILIFIPHSFGWEDFIGILLWGLMANILYSVGILLEIVNQYYLNGKFSVYTLRHFFFVLGTLLYMFITWVNTFLFYDSGMVMF